MGCTSSKPKTFDVRTSEEEDSHDYTNTSDASVDKTETTTLQAVSAVASKYQTERSSRLSQDDMAAPAPRESRETQSRKSQDLGEFLGSENNPYLSTDAESKQRRRRESVEQITQSIQRIQDSIDHTLATNIKGALKSGAMEPKKKSPKKSPKNTLRSIHEKANTANNRSVRPSSASPADPARSARTQGADFPSLNKKKKKEIKDIIYGANDLSPVFQLKQFEASQSPAYGGRSIPAMSLPRSLQRFSASRSYARQMPHSPQQLPHTYSAMDYPESITPSKKKKIKRKKKKKKKKKRDKRGKKETDFSFLYAEKGSWKRNPEGSRSRSVRNRYISDPSVNFGGGDMSDTMSDFGSRSRRHVTAGYYGSSRTVPVNKHRYTQQSFSSKSVSSSSSIEALTSMIDSQSERGYHILDELTKKRAPKLSLDIKSPYTPSSMGGSDMIYPVTRSLSSDSDRTISSSFGKYKETLFRANQSSSSKRVLVGPSSRIPLSPNSHSDSEEKALIESAKAPSSRHSRRRHRSADREYYRSDRHERERSFQKKRSRNDERSSRPNRRQHRYMSDQLPSNVDSYVDYPSSISSRRRQRHDFDRRERQQESDVSFETWRQRSDYRRSRRRRDRRSSHNGRRSARRSFDRLKQKYSFDDAYPSPRKKQRSPSPIQSPTKGGGNFDSEDDRERDSLSPLRDKPPLFTEDMRDNTSLDSISTLEDDTLRRLP